MWQDFQKESTFYKREDMQNSPTFDLLSVVTSASIFIQICKYIMFVL